MRVGFLVVAIMLPSVASASSPAAWAALDVRVTRSCLASSGLSGARVVAKLGFSDAVPVELRLIEGRAGGRIRTRVCVYSRTTGAVEVQDAPVLARSSAGRVR